MEMPTDSRSAAYQLVRRGRLAPSKHLADTLATLAIIRQSPGAAVGLWLLAIFVVLALLAGLIAPYDPYELVAGRVIHGPIWSASGSLSHPLGTDDIGRDLLSRLLYGLRLSLGFAVLATALAAAIGTALGLIAGYCSAASTWLDRLITLSLDTLWAIPLYLLALLFAARPSMIAMVLAVSLLAAVPFARLARSRCQQVLTASFVRAAKGYGTAPRRLLLTTVLPLCASPLICQAALTLSFALLAGATLSFLGLGAPAPMADLGGLIADGYPLALSHPWLTIAPGLCLSTLIISINLVGDGLRDGCDERMRLWP